MAGWRALRVLFYAGVALASLAVVFAPDLSPLPLAARNMLICLALGSFMMMLGRPDLAWIPITMLIGWSLFAGGDPDRPAWWSPLFQPRGVTSVAVISGLVLTFAIAPLRQRPGGR